jgi:uncharacterized protein (TIGR02217 family)
MSASVFPTTLALGWPSREIEWITRKQISISNKEISIADAAAARYTWSYDIDVLRNGTVAGDAWTEFATLFGFYNARSGGFDSFLYDDPDDDTVAAQAIGTGDGTTTAFQLKRTFGGVTDTILAPHAFTQVTVNGTPTGAYTFTGWGTTTPGIITFTSAPGATYAIAASFTYYWPVRFVADKCKFQKFSFGRYSVKSLAFKSVI